MFAVRMPVVAVVVRMPVRVSVSVVMLVSVRSAVAVRVAVSVSCKRTTAIFTHFVFLFLKLYEPSFCKSFAVRYAR